jgi:cyclic pyranopterin phosphate synthase
MTGLSDSFQRPINYLRISVTDRCNLRCIYCMPTEGVIALSHDDIISYEEIIRVLQAAAELGITKVRVTGGEPLVRGGLSYLIQMINNIGIINDVALTTNGILLGRYAAELKAAGLKRVNVSLDSLKPDKFIAITRGTSNLKEVLDSIETAKSAGLNPVKLNMVVMAGINDDEVIDFARKTITDGWNVRYIELMPFVGNGDTDPRFMPLDEIKKRLEPLGKLEPHTMKIGNGPAKYFRFRGAEGTVGFITPVTEHFCFNCNRLRLTSDGKLRPCLLAEDEIDLKSPLRSGVTHDDLKKLIQRAVDKKPLHHRLSEESVTAQRRPMRQVGG